MEKKELVPYREFLKDKLRLELNFHLTDQNQGVAPPPVQKPAREDQQRISLPTAETWSEFSSASLLDAIGNRCSHRRFKSTRCHWSNCPSSSGQPRAAKGVIAPGTALRTVPSAGCRHPFETYLAVTSVDGLESGIYRYLPIDNALVLERKVELEALQKALAQGTLNQTFTATAPVTFIWSVIPARSEWRYHIAAHRVILMDVGHVCQNLYLAVAAIGCGTCAIAAYHQQRMDDLLTLDGEEEFTIYLAPVGKVSEEPKH